ncbi:MAG: SDR family NAD(P)-dependent oxidoreductase [Streptosporangiaceae bacterium]
MGARVLAADVDQDRLAELGQQISEHGGHLEVVAADLTDPEACRRVVKEAAGRLGSIQVFLHAVGRNNRLPILGALFTEASLASSAVTGRRGSGQRACIAVPGRRAGQRRGHGSQRRMTLVRRGCVAWLCCRCVVSTATWVLIRDFRGGDAPPAVRR